MNSGSYSMAQSVTAASVHNMTIVADSNSVAIRLQLHPDSGDDSDVKSLSSAAADTVEMSE